MKLSTNRIDKIATISNYVVVISDSIVFIIDAIYYNIIYTKSFDVKVKYITGISNSDYGDSISSKLWIVSGNRTFIFSVLEQSDTNAACNVKEVLQKYPTNAITLHNTHSFMPDTCEIDCVCSVCGLKMKHRKMTCRYCGVSCHASCMNEIVNTYCE